LLERGRSRGKQRIEALKKQGLVEEEIDADRVRIAFVSLAMMPMLIKEIFEEQMEQPMDEAFLDELAELNGRLFAAGLLPRETEQKEK